MKVINWFNRIYEKINDTSIIKTIDGKKIIFIKNNYRIW